jgi:iron-sulfur cluster assembly protein
VLTLTPAAAEAIKAIVSSSPAPDGGLKITATPASDGNAALELSVAAAPAATDRVVEEAGSRVFVEELAAGELDDKVLDAQVEQDQVRFSLHQQPPPDPAQGL